MNNADRQLNAVRTGPRGGPPVVFLHPVGLDLTYWGDQIEALNGDYDVVAPDLPGHGRTPGSATEWTLPRATATVAQFLSSLGSPRVHLVGLSVGGMLAQALAIERPELVQSLTLIDTAASFTDDSRDVMRQRSRDVRLGGMLAVVDSTLERWFMPATFIARPDVVERVRRTLLGDDPAVHAAMWDMIGSLDLVAELPRIRCPTQVVVGEFDPSSPLAAARQLRDGIPGAGLRVIPQASHLSPLEKPSVVNELLRCFLPTAC